MLRVPISSSKLSRQPCLKSFRTSPTALSQPRNSSAVLALPTNTTKTTVNQNRAKPVTSETTTTIHTKTLIINDLVPRKSQAAI